MIEEFVPYEEALALKELGFNEPCFGYYLLGYTKIGYPSNIESCKNGFLDDKIMFSIPLYQQAFSWFREQYGLHSWVEEFGDGIYIPMIPKANFEKTIGYFNSNIGAELACLRKLIEITKNK